MPSIFFRNFLKAWESRHSLLMAFLDYLASSQMNTRNCTWSKAFVLHELPLHKIREICFENMKVKTTELAYLSAKHNNVEHNMEEGHDYKL